MRKRPIDTVNIKFLRIKFTAAPFKHIIMFRMIEILYRFEKV